MKHLARIIPLIRPYLWQVWVAILALAAIIAMQLAVPGIIQNVIDEGLARREIGFIATSALVIVAIGAVRSLVATLQRFLTESVSMRVAFDLRNRLFNHIQHLSFGYHDRAQTGQLVSRCIEDVGSVQAFLGFGAIELLQALFMTVGTLTLMFLTDARLAIIASLPIIPLVIQTSMFGARASALFYSVDNILGKLSSQLQENVTGVQVVRAFAREPHEIRRFDETNRELFHARVHVIDEWAKVMPTSSFLVALSTILILWFGGLAAIRGDLTVGQVVAFNAYVLLLAAPVQELIWLVNTAGEAAAGLQRAFEVLDSQPAIQSPPGADPDRTFRGQVTFENVSFAYEGEEAPALLDIELSVEPDQTVGIIGPTGSGKSTLVSLIPRFYDATTGAVRIDGADVREFDLTALRRKIGIVLQTSLLFSATIRENIALGRPDASEEEIFAAARAAQAHDFILRTPEKYATVVGERGITLSGGQRQRIAIARALLMDPRILILDDATSSVDTETEHRIQAALKERMAGRTTFVIAQRIASVRHADQILVMQGGRIIERGRHTDLLALGGLYNEINDLQRSHLDEFERDISSLTPSGDD
ncbi:MAG: ABC transporter ATP-binding protein [Anaerolineae bacterium]|nr:MAG: ABC transporter ATP-binding protein [Anaerolineae bacterium]